MLAGAKGVDRHGLPAVKPCVDYANGAIATGIELIRSTQGEKGRRIANVEAWQRARNSQAPSRKTSHSHMADTVQVVEPELHDGHGLGYLQQTARDRKNVFEALMEAVKTHSLGQISHALYDVGGEYRRNM